MCGIVGVIAKGSSGFNKFIEDSFLELLYVDAVRGYDSTGVVAVRKDGGFGIVKEATEAALFIPTFKGTQVYKDMYNNGKALIGHNRKKTVGEIKDETAHPFVIDNTFAMVHNGTLHGHKLLAEKDTDSEALASVFKTAFDADDYKTALEEVLGRVYGAYATVMYDQKRECIRFLRNKERPLWLLNTPEALYFASEPMMATWILCRNSYQYKDIKAEQIPEHYLITYDLVKNTIIEEKLTPKKATAVSYQSPTTTAKAGGTNCGGTTADIKPLTKQTLKFFRKKWLKERISFWVEDHVEAEFPKTIEEGCTNVYLFASCEEMTFKHSISVEVDLAFTGLKTTEELYEQRWTGIIDEIEYNEAAQTALLIMGKVKPVLNSVDKPKSTYVNRTQLEDKLKGQSLVYLQGELAMLKYKLCKWEIDVYEAEIAKKKQMVDALASSLEKSSHQAGLDAVLEEAKKTGRHVVHELRNGRAVYFDDDTNEVLYESPVLLH